MSRTIATWLLTAMLGVSSALPAAITNVTVVNVTPRSFTLCWRAPDSTPDVAVFAEAAGTTDLTDQLALEAFPLHAGSPAAATRYDQRLSRAALRDASRSQGLMLVRVSDCDPGATYHYRLSSKPNEAPPLVYPQSGPLPSVTLPPFNTFAVESRLLVLDVPGLRTTGRVVLLTHPDAAFGLAAVAGDGAATNQVFFNLSDLLALTGGQFAPHGDAVFTLELLGPQQTEVVERFTLNFTGAFTVAQSTLASFKLDFAALAVGSLVLRATTPGSVPLTLSSSEPLSRVTLDLELPPDQLAQFALDATAPELDPARTRLSILSPTSCRIDLVAREAHQLPPVGPAAQLRFVAATGQPSAFVSIRPSTFSAARLDSTPIATLLTQAGRVVVVAEEPLLEATRAADGQRQLILYGKPWSSYALESAPTPTAPGTWQRLTRIPMLSLSTVIRDLATDSPGVYYRAHEFSADPPLLEAQLAADGTRSLLAYGQANRPYTVLEAPRLSNVLSWRPFLNYTLTNSFQFIPLPTVPDTVVYRLQRD